MPSPAEPFRVGIVPGVTVAKWTRAWKERRPRVPLEVIPLAEAQQRAALDARKVDVCFVRLPIERDNLNVIRLYSEVPVVVVAKEHPISLFEAVTRADLEGEVERHESAADAVEIVAAGAGYVRLPHSIARLHARKDVAAVPLSDAPETEVAIAWPIDATSDDVEYFVGIVRGRSAASSRGAAPAKAESSAPAKRRGAAPPKSGKPSGASGKSRASRGGTRRGRR
ncbi:MAG: LysR family transcriptional regulator substrate-binding protein [Salinibacterium sp.]|nr:LysR family transcriptional regulator substrate-binding protein [Salinibacterium sp.]MBF0671075.1 LysR family transcriptional regulator substrate-binding protein [Salinibacterium sp.]